MRTRILSKRTKQESGIMDYEECDEITVMKNLINELSEDTSRHLNDIQKQIDNLTELKTENLKDNLQSININVECEEDPMKLSRKLLNTFEQALDDAEKIHTGEEINMEEINKALRYNNLVPKNPVYKEDEHIIGITVPSDAYDEEGELKESYRKAYRTLLEENLKKHKQTLQTAIEDTTNYDNEEYIQKPKPQEIADHTSYTIKHLITDLIENTGIIEETTLTFKKTLTETILLTLSQYKNELTTTNLKWEITHDTPDHIKLTLKNK